MLRAAPLADLHALPSLARPLFDAQTTGHAGYPIPARWYYPLIEDFPVRQVSRITPALLRLVLADWTHARTSAHEPEGTPNFDDMLRQATRLRLRLRLISPQPNLLISLFQ